MLDNRNATCLVLLLTMMKPLQLSASASSKVSSSSDSLSSLSGPTPASISETQLKELSRAIESGDFFAAEKLLQALPQQVRQSDIEVIILEALVDKGFYRAAAARSKLKKALRLDRSNGNALFEMAVLLMEKRLWRRSEVLLRAAAASPNLSESRRRSLPYYQGVTAFESGRLFESRNHFTRLNWMDAVDFAIRRSSTSYLNDIAGKRPWSVVAPVLFQYESNVLGLDDSTALPEGYTQKGGGKVVYGLFGNYSGLGGKRRGQGPWAFSLRTIASLALERQFQSLNLLFAEAEVTWSALSAEKNPMSVSPSVNAIQVDGKALSHSAQLKLSLNQSDVSVGFEFDATRDSTSDRSVWFSGLARTFEILQGDSFAVVQPTELAVRVPVSEEKGGEYKTDVSLSPGINWSFGKRTSLSLSDQFSWSRISGKSVQYNIMKNGIGLKSSVSVQPFLVLGLGYEFEVAKRTDKSSFSRKSTTTLNVLGLL